MRRSVLVASTLGVGLFLPFVRWRMSERVDACATTVVYGGTTYSPHMVSEEVQGADDVERIGIDRGCADKGPYTLEVAVTRIPGVDPRQALSTPTSARVLYVAQGATVSELPTKIAALVAR